MQTRIFPQSISFAAFIFISFCRIITMANAQDEFATLRELWRSGQYAEVVRRGAEIRELPFGRMAELDYMIGTSLCRLPDLQKNGVRHLAWCLSRYNLDEESRVKILREMQLCAEAIPAAVPAIIILMTSKASVGIGVSGKMYHYLNPDHAVRTTPIKIVAPKSLKELSARLTPVTQPDSAARKISKLVDSTFEVKAFGKFVIANANPKTDRPEMARRLGIYEKFFASVYGLKLPPYMITVYVVPEIRQFRALALKLHGFQLPDASIGYSYREDMSLLAFCQAQWTGTLYHELFHLMARSTFGDIPPWLDEGMAALYEVSLIDGERALGVNNWRGRVLDQLWHVRPSIENLVQMDWQTFDKIENEYQAEKQAVNHATARYLMQYLQDQGKLAEVFNAMRLRQPEDYQTTPEADAIVILENILQKPIAKIDADFASWFRAERRWP
ncbi:MAG: hypothetical protein ONA90_09525 [candidate division KSB1 bacterium]|nr:hypothetical protein [candidate division KSB1 bacterium]